MGKQVFSLIMAGVLTAGLLLGCGSNSEDTQNAYTVQSEQATDEQKQGEESDEVGGVNEFIVNSRNVNNGLILSGQRGAFSCPAVFSPLFEKSFEC